MEVTLVSKLYSIFNSKEWNQNESNETVFESFCNLLSNITPEQSQLILDLTERYIWITLGQYQGKLIKTLNSVEDEKIEKLKRIILFPIMKPEDEHKTKSGHAVLYMVRGIKPMLKKYNHITFLKIENYEGLREGSLKLTNTDAIFLLDDYLGSGETIQATLDGVLNINPIPKEYLNVISIASQLTAFEYVTSLNISIYTDIVTTKGISDFYSNAERDDKTKIMMEIEKMISGNHFSFGYNQSEALITLIRTPDNTFPIFWKAYRKNNKKF